MTRTTLLYQKNASQRTASAVITHIERTDSTSTRAKIILDQTIFYPQGGGQPADHGTIKGADGELKVTHVSYNGGAVLHQGELTGELSVGETVHLEIDWDRRWHHMQLHTAGHLLDQAVKNVVKNIYGVDGDHGIGKRNFVAFNGEVALSDVPKINKELTRLIQADLPITTRMTTKQELESDNVKLPFKLPENKDLRIVQIGDYMPMPDGGTHLERTGDLGAVTVETVIPDQDLWKVAYTISDMPKTTSKTSHTKTPKTDKTKNTNAVLSIEDFQARISDLRQQARSLTVKNSEELRIALFGKSKGLFTAAAALIRDTAAQDRKAAGEKLQDLRGEFETMLTQAETSTHIHTAWQDPTLPAYDTAIGRRHPVSQAISEIAHIFGKLGFTRVRYPEVEWEYYPFEALNMPSNHPARDEWETFFVNAKPHSQLGRMVLTPHTSNGQPREMERLKSTPPIRMVNLARTYRRQQDATHLQMFHQFEGLVVDKGITIQDLKGTIEFFAREFYGPGATSRLRPFHFQFTEPSFEVDFSCTICNGTGRVGDEPCKFCKSGWHEVGGAGMVHPNVLRAGGIDPDKYTGFAFGWGVERTYALRPGLHLDDIRHLYSGDLRFLQQF